MISYEVAISLIIMPIILFSGSVNLNDIIIIQQITCWLLFPLFPLSVIFMISILAETNRAPFDLPEAEAELVAGYNVEYSAITFAAFFLGEYANILLMSSLFVIFFLGGNIFSVYSINTTSLFCLNLHLLTTTFLQQCIFAIKTVFITFIFIFIRANLPRFRFDQLMYIG
jgi:NADH-quinone oxidoreductase subunit H